MSEFSDLAYLVTFRPLSKPLSEPTTSRRISPFRAGWKDTVGMLAREVRAIADGGRTYGGWGVMELDFSEQDFRLDGLPRANAKQRSPAIVVSIESHHGPLRYEVDAFLHWQDNVRAIALGLEALRKVDRYGITKRGEQYAGWKALPQGDGPSASRGQRVVEERYDGNVRRALSALHPDTGAHGSSSSSDFADVIAYKESIQ